LTAHASRICLPRINPIANLFAITQRTGSSVRNGVAASGKAGDQTGGQQLDHRHKGINAADRLPTPTNGLYPSGATA